VAVTRADLADSADVLRTTMVSKLDGRLPEPVY
jgi:DNA-binding XRE family transcriptional regulator